MAEKTDYGFNAEEAINSIRPDTPKRQSREKPTIEVSEPVASPSKDEARQTAKSTEKKTGRNVLVEEYQEWLKSTTDFNSRAGKSCNIRQRYHYRIAKMIGLLSDKNISISTYIDMVLSEHFKKYDEAMDILMKQKFNEMQQFMNKDE